MIELTIHAPLMRMFEIAETDKSMVFEIPAENVTSLKDVFNYMSLSYPKFRVYLDLPQGNFLRSVFTILDGKIVICKEDYSSVLVQDGAKISMHIPYQGG